MRRFAQSPWLLTLTLALALPCLPACDSADTPAAAADAGVDATASDGADTAGGTVPVTLTIAGVVGDQPAVCGKDFSGLGSGDTTAQLADARVFVSGVEVQNAAGSWVAVQLDQGKVWQAGDVALLDYEDATGGCKDTGTPEINNQINGVVPAGSYKAVRFAVGVPFASNHSNNALATAPLNTPGMFWTWQGGYKFVRVDWSLGAGKRWNLHVGSTGCVSADKVTAPTEPCGNPNLARVSLAVADATKASLQLDLGQLMAGVNMAKDTASTAPGCMSGPTEPADCGGSWTALGMDFTTGLCQSDCSGQSAWSAVP